MLKTGFRLFAFAALIGLLMFSVRAFAATLEIFMYGAIFGCASTVGVHLALRYGKGPMPGSWWKGAGK